MNFFAKVGWEGRLLWMDGYLSEVDGAFKEYESIFVIKSTVVAVIPGMSNPSHGEEQIRIVQLRFLLVRIIVRAERRRAGEADL